MTTFMIDTDNNITAFAHPQEAETAANGQSFTSQEALETLTASWPMDRFVTVWNSFAGVAGFSADLKPVKKFENRNKAVARIWKALQLLNGDPTPGDASPAETANTAPKGAKGERAKGNSGKKSTPPKKGPKTRSKAIKPAKTEAGAPREGQQDRPGRGDAATQEWRDAFRDHALRFTLHLARTVRGILGQVALPW